ncbi:MAG TPA: hypothetical protein VFV37_05835, partial [Luteibaculaceae bacterium]|nr:hypothetical protein [Luteibaculaceae bacterium]
MIAKDIITSGLLEAYALGVTSPEETALVLEALKNPEVRRELEEIEDALWQLAKQSEKEVPANVKMRLDEDLFSQTETDHTPETTVVSINRNESISIWKVAAGIALAISLGLNVFQYSSSRQLSEQLAELTKTNDVLAGEVKVVRQDLDFYGKISDFFQRGEIKSFELQPMPNKQGRAMLYCDLKTGKVAVKPMGLPALDNQHQYQLWALIDGKPV